MAEYFVCKSITDIGLRDENQDSVFISSRDKLCICAVSDGVGSLTDGGYAARFATKKLEDWFRGADASKNNELLKKELLSVLSDINTQLLAYAEEHGITTGATLSLTLLNERRLIAVNLGDSRIYRLSRGRLSLLTKDDTVLMQQDDGSERQTLTQCLGLHKYISANVIEGEIERGGRLLLCTDGYWRRSGRMSLSLSMLRITGLQRHCERLRKLGEDDNISAGYIRLK